MAGAFEDPSDVGVRGRPLMASLEIEDPVDNRLREARRVAAKRSGLSWPLGTESGAILVLISVVVFLGLGLLSSAGGSSVDVKIGEAGGQGMPHPNDLWGVHDLLLIGWQAVMLQDEALVLQAKGAVLDVARHLPALHPHADCRTRFAQIAGCSAGEVAPPIGEAELRSMANASWACLPGAFTVDDFSISFGIEAQGNPALRPERSNQLGACSGSRWPRACSYWIAFHAMAARADMLLDSQTKADWLVALSVVIRSGVTMCIGCTAHFQLLMQPMLPMLVGRQSFRDV